MKKYIVIILSVLLISVVFIPKTDAAISFVNSSVFSNNAAGTSATSSLNVTAGNLIVLSCRHGTTFVAPTSATDTLGNVFTQFAIASNSSAGAITGYWTISSGTNAADIIGCNFASSVGGRSLVATQYSGVASTNPIDVSAVNATNTSLSAFGVGTFSTDDPNELIVGMASVGAGTMTAGTGYTLEATTTFGGGPTFVGTEDKTVSSIQTNVSTTFNSSVSSHWMAVVGSFIQAAGSAVTSSALTVRGKFSVAGSLTIK